MLKQQIVEILRDNITGEGVEILAHVADLIIEVMIPTIAAAVASAINAYGAQDAECKGSIKGT